MSEEDQVNEAKAGSPVTAHQDHTLGQPVPDQVLDGAISQLIQSPFCCHCGNNINGALKTQGAPFHCPACAGTVRCVYKGIWLERVSPLDLQAPPPMQRH
jgi:hypothetical protein